MEHLTEADIDRIAGLARLALSKEEKSRYAGQLSAVFGYMDMLNEVDTDDVPETCQVTGLEDVYRDDVPQACDADVARKLIAAFPERVGNLLKVPGVFE
jgi:aspartyl-tRNA(Asn)/glutamyl-tRNA(Gln) amidotransferase subunit C